MDPYRHAHASAQRHGGTPSDYYALHGFFDCTKEICSDNRHRLLHTTWGIRNVILPIFGPVLHNSSGASVATKTVCEADHVMADYQFRFIPTLGDFVDAIEPHDDDLARLREVSRAYEGDAELSRLLLSPLALTGRVRALLITHNSWFLNEIVPRVLKRPARVREFEIGAGELFARMRYELWMDNGACSPPSSRGLPKPSLQKEPE